MCGRFSLTTPEELMAEAFGLEGVAHPLARYNIAPSQPVATVRSRGPGGGSRQLELLKWGLSRATGPEEGSESAGGWLINARSETVAAKPAFREAFRSRRCLIPADGFYEWRRAGSRREPFHMRLHDGRLFAFAGLWQPGAGQQAGGGACVILTTGANPLVARIHDRMPVILQPGDYPVWLDPGIEDDTALKALLRPYDAARMTAVPVSQFVNDARNEGPRCLEPERQLSLFDQG